MCKGQGTRGVRPPGTLGKLSTRMHNFELAEVGARRQLLCCPVCSKLPLQLLQSYGAAPLLRPQRFATEEASRHRHGAFLNAYNEKPTQNGTSTAKRLRKVFVALRRDLDGYQIGRSSALSARLDQISIRQPTSQYLLNVLDCCCSKACVACPRLPHLLNTAFLPKLRFTVAYVRKVDRARRGRWRWLCNQRRT